MSTTDNTFKITPVALFRCDSRYPAEVPRQPNWADNEGIVELLPAFRDPQMIEGLAGFSHIWVQFIFHKNSGWKTMTDPPYQRARKIGTWASRSPYRPNGLGLSCLQVKAIKNHRIHIKNHDLLDGTPVVDIKPYVTQSDCYPQAKEGWLNTVSREIFQIEYMEQAEKQILWLKDFTGIDFKGFIHTQLSHDPFDLQKKRIHQFADGDFEIGHRTWRIVYSVKSHSVLVQQILSGYCNTDLILPEDPYGDKGFHRQFLLESF